MTANVTEVLDAAVKFHAAGQLAQAEQAYRQALAANPDFAEAHYNLGMVLNALHKPGAAAESFQQALRIRPDYIKALNNLGNTLLDLRRYGEAAEVLAKTIKLNPRYVPGYCNLSTALRHLRRFDEALSLCETALAIDPQNVTVLNNLGTTLIDLRRFAEATLFLRQAVEINPQYTKARRNLVLALRELGRLDEAFGHGREVIAQDPNDVHMMIILANGALLLHRLEEYVAYCEKWVASQPDNPRALESVGIAYLDEGKIDAAIAAFDRALEIAPDSAAGHYCRGMAYFFKGDYARGWVDYDWRWQTKEFVQQDFSQPLWKGEDLRGKSILVRAEQGLGDTIHFARYLKPLRDQGCQVIFGCQTRLEELLKSCSGIDQLVPDGSTLPSFDAHVALLNVPRFVGLPDPKDSPQPPYLFADPELIGRWQRKLAEFDGIKVGINWQGDPKYTKDRFRSIPLKQFLPLADVPGVRLVSLQKGFGREQLEECGQRERIVDLGCQLDEQSAPFMDTAALLQSLDLLITSDTAIAHLAGALGRPVWVALSTVPDWRWQLHGETTPWYPSMRLFRQSQLGQWEPVFQEIATALRSFSSALQESPRPKPLLDSVPRPGHDTTAKSLREVTQHFQAGRFAEAEKICRRLLAENDKQVDAWHLLGLVLHHTGRSDEGLVHVREALRLKPDFAHAHFNCAGILLSSKRFSEAVDAYRRTLELKPDYAEAYFSLGNALVELGKSAEAIEAFQKAIQIDPKHVKAMNNLGLALYGVNRVAEAASAFEQTLKTDPSYVNGHVNLVVALLKLSRLEEALTHCHQALALAPKHTDALTNLGCVLVEMGRFDEAVAWSRAAVESDPGNYQAIKGLGVALMHQCRVRDAIEALDQSLAIRPDFATGHTDRAMAYLVSGDYARGWPEYEWRRRTKEFNVREFSQPPWEGSDLAGKTLFVYAEQGLGDSLQFVRYLPLIRERGGRVIFECPKNLHRLLSHSRGIDELIPLGQPLPPFDFHAPLLSLPHLLGLPEPQAGPLPPYLFPDPELIAHWKRELDALGGFKVGINWQGNPKHPKDHFRSVPLTQFLPLAQIPGVRLISLQKGFGKEQLETLPQRELIVDLAARLDLTAGAFMDTAAVLQSLDLVITSDTALAHLAGGLGVPVWVVLPSIPDWRWLLSDDTTGWYPSMRLFRQPSINDWDSVFDRMLAELAKLVAGRSSNGQQHATHETFVVPNRNGRAAPSPPAELLSRVLHCFQKEDYSQAEDLCRTLLSVEPGQVDAWHLRGLAMQKTGRRELALEYLKEALRLKPDFAEAHLNLANLLRDCGRSADAVASYQRCLQFRPDLAEAHYNLANAWNDLGRHEEAIEAFRAATRIRPNYVKALNNLGTTLLDMGRPAEGAEVFEQTLSLNPNYVAGYCNLASALHKLGRFEDGVAKCRQALTLDPKCGEALNNLSTVFIDQGKIDDALVTIDQALAINPEYAKAHLNRAIAWLLTGDFARGWPEFEWRWRTKTVVARAFPQPRWDGADLAGKTILVHFEQGHGDIFHFVRYLPLVRQRGGRVLFECPANLHRVLANAGGVDELISAGSALPQFDVQVPLMSLPHALGLPDPSDSPPPPYLSAETDLIAQWQAELAALDSFKIGINWQGNPKHTKDQFRSLPLAQLLPLAEIPGVQLISLQKGFGKEQLNNLPDPDLILDLGSRLDETTSAFVDTAAVLHSLDLVITSDTALAHLAGALGRPVWLLLSAAPDWRWLRQGDSTPWYPSMRIFRQSHLKKWESVLAQVARELEHTLANSACQR